MSEFESDPTNQAKRVSEDIAVLKEDVANLVRQMKNLAGRYSQSAADNISDQAADFYETVSKKSRHGVDAVGGHIEEKPVTSLLLAFAAGFIFSKIVTR